MISFNSAKLGDICGALCEKLTLCGAGSFANASGATSYVLGNLADLIDRSVDCNVGLGLRHIFQP